MIEIILDRLSSYKLRKTSKGWISCCPAHNDRSPSLSIRETEDGKVLAYCHAGCSFSSIAHSLGLSEQDFFVKGDRESNYTGEIYFSKRKIDELDLQAYFCFEYLKCFYLKTNKISSEDHKKYLRCLKSLASQRANLKELGYFILCEKINTITAFAKAGKDFVNENIDWQKAQRSIWKEVF